MKKANKIEDESKYIKKIESAKKRFCDVESRLEVWGVCRDFLKKENISYLQYGD
jgi:hypothetical protein